LLFYWGERAVPGHERYGLKHKEPQSPECMTEEKRRGDQGEVSGGSAEKNAQWYSSSEGDARTCFSLRFSVSEKKKQIKEWRERVN